MSDMLIIFASVHANHRGASVPQPSDFYRMMSSEAAKRLSAEVLDPAKDARLAFVEQLYKLQRHDHFRDRVIDNLYRWQPEALLRHHHALIERGYLMAIDVSRAQPHVIDRLREMAADARSPLQRAALSVLLVKPGAADDLYEAYLRNVQPDDEKERWAIDLLKYGDAGWEPDGRGGRRLLRIEPTRQLVGELTTGDPLVRPDATLDVPCPSCGKQRLIVMFDLDTTRADLKWLRLPLGHLRLPACEVCMWMSSHEGYVFCEVDLAGSVRPRPDLSPRNSGDSEWSILPRQPLYLGPIWLPEAGHDPEGGTLGGSPRFEQEPDWPNCPSCNRLMRYVGQLSTGGWTYSFLCPECMLATWGAQID